ncbi:hypothetical protein SVIOM74S_03806 [Streptomyces violarus]
MDSGKAGAEASSVVLHRSAEDKEKAVEVAKTLGLSADDVKKGEPGRQRRRVRGARPGLQGPVATRCAGRRSAPAGGGPELRR